MNYYEILVLRVVICFFFYSHFPSTMLPLSARRLCSSHLVGTELRVQTRRFSFWGAKDVWRNRGITHLDGGALSCSFFSARSFSTPPPVDPDEAHRLFKEQVDEMNAEREELFGFEDGEREAWGSGNEVGSRMSAEELNRVNGVLSSRGREGGEGGGGGGGRGAYEDDASASFYNSFGGGGGELADMTHIGTGGDGKTTFKMVDTSAKGESLRIATAEARVVLPDSVNRIFREEEGKTAKGNVFDVSRLAGIMGAKKTSDLIPLCHNINIDEVDVDMQYIPEVETVLIKCTSRTVGKTGVEMEALTGASVAALAFVDMVKGVSPEVVYTVRLLEKEGGKRLVRGGKVVVDD